MVPAETNQTLWIEDNETSSSRKLLVGFFLLALLFHLFIFVQHYSGFQSAPLPPVELNPMNTQQLDRIKRQWREKSLLLDRSHTPKTETLAPEDARYFSDRNIRVEKEQRARDTSPTVKPRSAAPTREQAAPHPKAEQSKTLPDLKSLGLPLFKKAPDRQLAGQQAQEHHNTPSPQQDAGAQYIPDQSLPSGSENLLNAQESVFYSFYARIYDAIGPVWQSKIRQTPRSPGLRDGDYSTLVDVVLDASGNLIQVNLLQSSGVREFDQTVHDSWRKLDQFPNPPKGLLNADHQIHMGWTFTVHVAKGLFFEAPSRSY